MDYNIYYNIDITCNIFSNDLSSAAISIVEVFSVMPAFSNPFIMLSALISVHALRSFQALRPKRAFVSVNSECWTHHCLNA